MIEEKNLINLTNKIDNCHTHFTHFPKPKWQTILEQLLNYISCALTCALTRVLMKIFPTRSMDVVNECREIYG